MPAMKEAVLHTTFLDLQKVYNALDRYQCLDILAGYGMGPQTLRLLKTYCTWLWMFAKAGGYFAPPFQV